MSTFDFDDQQATQDPSLEGVTIPEPDRPAEDGDGDDQQLALRARADLLEAENRRLRAEYARLQQSRYRTRALGLLAIAILAVGGATAFPGVRDVLLVLAAIGAVGAVLTYYLSPGAFVAADVGERIYAALAGNLADLAGSLGLDERRLYVPGHEEPACRLFVPHHPDVGLPDGAVDGPIVTDEDARGLVLEPTGHALFDAFERGLTTDLATRPGPLASQLTDALVEQFELANGAEATVEPAQVTVAISKSTVGDVDRFDHPIASFLATGLAIGLEQPVELEVARGDGRTDWLVTCRWVQTGRADRTDGTDETTEMADTVDADRTTETKDRDETAPPREPGDSAEIDESEETDPDDEIDDPAKTDHESSADDLENALGDEPAETGVDDDHGQAHGHGDGDADGDSASPSETPGETEETNDPVR